jgi:hypothetical protein
MTPALLVPLLLGAAESLAAQVPARDSACLVSTRLVTRRTGRPDQPRYALDDRLFIGDGVPGFWVFERHSTGTVGDLINWRDNNPVRWKRQP